jgi:hypothetical protein
LLKSHPHPTTDVPLEDDSIPVYDRSRDGEVVSMIIISDAMLVVILLYETFTAVSGIHFRSVLVHFHDCVFVIAYCRQIIYNYGMSVDDHNL